jgi:hypothetical protein
MLIGIALILTVTACANGHVKDNFCLLAKPIYVTGQEIDLLSDETIKWILYHNEVGRQKCDWQEPE